MVFEINVLTISVMAVLCGLSTYLSNQRIAVYHDGIRPLFPQYFAGKVSRREFLATSFALSVGFIFGLALPTSIAGQIILIHLVLLAGDVLGCIYSDKGYGKWFAAGTGAIYGVILMFALEGFLKVIEIFPVNFISSLGMVGSIVIVAFSVFPVVAVALQHGYKKASIVFFGTVLVKQITALYGTFQIKDVTVGLSADGMALMFSITMMVIFAAKDRNTGEANDVFAIFEKNIDRIKSNMLILAITGGILAMATTLLLVAENPATLSLMASGDIMGAALVSLGRAIGFIPLVMTTAIVTGVYSPFGTKMLHVPAILFINMGIFGLVGSFFVGCLVMVLEILLLGYIGKGMSKFPGMKDLGDHIRTSMGMVLDLALLIGGMLAANQIAPTIGYIWVLGIYFLNQYSKKPIATMAIGPLATILLGILVNILHFIGLFPI